MIATYAFQFSQKATNLTIVGALVLVVTAVMLMRTIDRSSTRSGWCAVAVRGRRAWRLTGWPCRFGPLLLAGGVFLWQRRC